MNNPYTFTFGKEPHQYISRISQTEEILNAFEAEEPSRQVFILTGIRGSGKTVLMTEISKKLKARSNWLVVELNPESDLLASLGAKLYSDNRLADLFDKLGISLSLFGFSAEIKPHPQIIDMETAISRLMNAIAKKGKRILISIDEVTNNANIRKFVGAFQILLRQDAPVFLLMTGLYENISELQDMDTLTFLYRAPKCFLKPLNLSAIVNNYKTVFGISREEALEMANLTKGYSFAFQVLGYLTYENGGSYKEILDQYRQYLEEYVYEKIWSELSKKDQEIAASIARCPDGRIQSIRDLAKISTNEFNPYRKRLIKKGLLNGDRRGYVSFVLPLFDEFVLDQLSLSPGLRADSSRSSSPAK